MYLFLLALLGCTPSPSPPPTAEPPAATTEAPFSVVIVLSDALRAANVGAWGYPRPTTPTLDALAVDAMVFEHAFAGFPATPVSVSQLMTGQWMPPLVMGTRYLAVPVRELPDDHPLLPRRLDGFRTGLVSSHYWYQDDSRLLSHFDTVDVVDSDASYAPFEALLAPTERFLDGVGDAPFLLFVHSMDTHGPWGPPDPDLAADWPEALARYDTDLRRTDAGVAKIIEALKARGLWERTVFVFTSDHGEEFGELGPERWNRNHGLQVRRPLAHVPLLVRLPGNRSAGRYRAAVSLVDLAPTLATLARPDWGMAGVDGRNLAAAWLAGRDGDPEQPVYGWSGRWWAAYLPEVELHDDRWTGEATLWTPQPDAHNYPRLTPLDDPERTARLAQQVAEVRDAALRRYLALPDKQVMPQTASLAVPMTLAPDSAARPVFADRPDDGQWSLPGRALMAWPEETVAPITVTTAWSA